MSNFISKIVLPCLLVLSTGLAYAADTFIVVHPDNPIHDLRTTAAIDLILQNKGVWHDGEPIRCILPPHSSPTFKAMLHNLLQMEEFQWRSYWQREQSYGKFTPHAVADEQAVIQGVARDLHAVGVVSEKFLEGEDRRKVKIVFRIKPK